jgi:hypothetical protein
MDHVGLVRTVAVQDYVGGHFELEQSDMIFDAVLGTGPLDRQGEDYDRIVASLGRVLGPVDRIASWLLHPQADLAMKKHCRY